jgi:ubiquinone biosynthesis monooxygenase Coq7
MKKRKFAHFVDDFMKICFQSPEPSLCYPAEGVEESLFSWNKEQLDMARWQMKIDHTGEVCAQALYAGHKNHDQCSSMQQWLDQAKREEYAHLQWCSQRLSELGSSPSKADPIFYLLSYGLARGLSHISEGYNVCFIRETERQVGLHLQSQFSLLVFDPRSWHIVHKMREEEQEHHDQAQSRETMPMPKIFQSFMSLSADLMKYTVKYI